MRGKLSIITRMIHIPEFEFTAYMEEAIANLPKTHHDAIKNIAFFVRDKPSEEQLQKGGVKPGWTLFGLYEGIPLTQREGTTPYLPDIITLFQEPIESVCDTVDELKEQIRHTVWHEVAHYFGLNHDDIQKRE